MRLGRLKSGGGGCGTFGGHEPRAWQTGHGYQRRRRTTATLHRSAAATAATVANAVSTATSFDSVFAHRVHTLLPGHRIFRLQKSCERDRVEGEKKKKRKREREKYTKVKDNIRLFVIRWRSSFFCQFFDFCFLFSKYTRSNKVKIV